MQVVKRCKMIQPCCVPPKPFIFVLDATEFILRPLQLRLQALNANNSLHQVLVKIRILLLQCPKWEESSRMVVWNMLDLLLTQTHFYIYQYFKKWVFFKAQELLSKPLICDHIYPYPVKVFILFETYNKYAILKTYFGSRARKRRKLLLKSYCLQGFTFQ